MCQFSIGDFAASFPLFLVGRNARESQGKIEGADWLSVTVEGKRALAVFTDDDLASRAAGKVAGQVCGVNSPSALIALMKELPCEAVTFDPDPGVKARIPVSVEEAVDAFERASDGG